MACPGFTIRQISTPVRTFGLDDASGDRFAGVDVDGVDGAGIEVEVEVGVDVGVGGGVVVGAGAATAVPPIPMVRVRAARPPRLNFPILFMCVSPRVIWTPQKRR